jgi:hypothetical protein
VVQTPVMFSDVGVDAALPDDRPEQAAIFALLEALPEGEDLAMSEAGMDPTLQGAVAAAARALYCSPARLSDLFRLDPATR